MQLTDEQKREVSAWIDSGAKLSEMQQRLAETFGIRMTYMEARFLIDDLKLVPQEKVQPEEKKTEPAQPAPHGLDASAPQAGGGVGVRVVLDEIVRPGALVSGSVTFSDGGKADWSLDQMGRLSLVPDQKDYRPSQADFAEFRKVLERELTRQGL